jgi:hypothetical protein
MKRNRIAVVCLVVGIIVYAGSYIVLSLTGEYRTVKAKPRDMLYEPAGKAYDVEMWFPSGVVYQNDNATDFQPRQMRSNWLGLLFRPLLAVDRGCIHQTAVIIDVIDPDWKNKIIGEQEGGGYSPSAARSAQPTP